MLVQFDSLGSYEQEINSENARGLNFLLIDVFADN